MYRIKQTYLSRSYLRKPAVLFLLIAFALWSCGGDDSPSEPTATGNQIIYDFNPTTVGASHNMTGEVKIDEFSDGSALITVSLQTNNLRVNPVNFGATGVPIEAVIFSNNINSLANQRQVLITLNSVGTRGFGSTSFLLGNSQTKVTQLDDGTPVTYSELLALDAHIRLSFEEFDYATGNIGSND